MSFLAELVRRGESLSVRADQLELRPAPARGHAHTLLPRPRVRRKLISRIPTDEPTDVLLKRIHFYEYYWAYNVEGTTIWHVLVWLTHSEPADE